MTASRHRLARDQPDARCRFRAVLVIALLVSVLAVAAYDHVSASEPVAEAPETTEEFEIGGNSTWKDAFDQLGASEQQCIRGELGYDLEDVLGLLIVDTDVSDPPAWLQSMVSCLTDETTRFVGTVILVRYLLDSLGLVLSEDEESCLRLSWLNDETEQSLVQCVSDLFRAIDEDARATDDHAATRREATAIAEGRTSAGKLHAADDIDIFEYQAVAGARYRLDVGLKSLRSALVLLVHSEGRILASFNASEHSGESTAIWLAPASGSYFVAVLGPYASTGTYHVAVTRIVDDHPDNASGAATLAIGETVEGSVDYYEDRDVFTFQVEEGEFYLLDVGLGTLEDSTLAIEEADGELRAHNNDRYRGEHASRIVWKAPTTGRFYAAVGSDGSEIGSYTLTLSTIEDDHVDRRPGSTTLKLGVAEAGVLNYERDTDVFAFTAEEGVIYDIAVDAEEPTEPKFGVLAAEDDWLASNIQAEDVLAPRIWWKAVTGGTHYVALGGQGTGSYTLTVRATALVDRHGDSPQDASDLSFGQVVNGAVDHVHDKDYFAFEAKSGVIYRIAVGSGTLSEPLFRVVGADNWYLAANDDYYGSPKTEFLWEATTSARYYVAVRGHGNGTYRLQVDETRSVDRHGDTMSDASAIVLGKAVVGGIEHIYDEDVFTFTASEGAYYEIVLILRSLEYGAAHVRDVDKEILAHIDLDDDPRIERQVWKAPANGEHYVFVNNHNGHTGSYTLLVRTSSVVDDHADDPSHASRARVGQVVKGALEHEEDMDVFAFAGVEGVLYDIAVALGTLEDAVMTVLDSEGVVLRWDNGSDYEEGPRSFPEVPASGAYYVKIVRDGWNARPGTYSLSISRVEDDHADSGQSATTVAIGERVQGSIDHDRDQDWFVFAAKKGVAYRIEARPGSLLSARLYLEDASAEWLASNSDSPTASIVFYATSTDKHFVKVGSSSYRGVGTYTLTVNAVTVVDEPGRNLVLGETVGGSVDYVGDWDVFYFEAEAEARYEIVVTGETLATAIVKLWYDDGGTALASKYLGEDDPSARLRWRAPASGSYHITVRGSFYHVGSYTVTINESTEPNVK